MSYIVDRILNSPETIAVPSSASDPINLWSSIAALPATSLQDLVVYLHNPAGSGANLYVGLFREDTAVTATVVSISEGLTFTVVPGDTFPLGIRRGAGEIFLTGNGAAINIEVTIASVTGVQAC
jgi:hypothetical protein